MAGDENDQAEQPDFEDVVAALLQVDPSGIIGTEGKAARAEKRIVTEQVEPPAS